METSPLISSDVTEPNRWLERCLERLLDRLRIVVIFGGDKSAPGAVVHETANVRPWKSYEEVAHDIAGALTRIGFRHVQPMPDDIRLFDRLRDSRADMAWLNSGGVQGYNSAAHAASMLELAGIPYVGHGPLTTTVLDNKHIFKAVAMSAGIPTARFATWDGARGRFHSDASVFRQAFYGYRGPFIVKPVSGRASLHVHLVDEQGLAQAIDHVTEATNNLVLIEEFLPGREFCVAACGPAIARAGKIYSRGTPLIFALIERLLDRDEAIFTSMDVRPIANRRVRPIEPRSEQRLGEGLHRLGIEVFQKFQLDALVRIDIREDQNGKLHVLEANPKPDLRCPTDGTTNLICAGLPRGTSYDDLILSLFVQRLDRMLANHAPDGKRVVALIDDASLAPRKSNGGREAAQPVVEAAANANVQALRSVLRAGHGCEFEHAPAADPLRRR